MSQTQPMELLSSLAWFILLAFACVLGIWMACVIVSGLVTLLSVAVVALGKA
jgi:hypothetical protein